MIKKLFNSCEYTPKTIALLVILKYLPVNIKLLIFFHVNGFYFLGQISFKSV